MKGRLGAAEENIVMYDRQNEGYFYRLEVDCQERRQGGHGAALK